MPSSVFPADQALPLLVTFASGLALGATALLHRNRNLAHRLEEVESRLDLKCVELDSANEALRRHSLSDPLTGLRSGRYLHLTVREDVIRILRAYQYEQSGRRKLAGLEDLVFAAVALDLPPGNAAPDNVLACQFADLLQSTVRETDCVVRWGEDTFMIVAKGGNRREAPLLLERIRQSVHQHGFRTEDASVRHLTCSMGSVAFPFAVEFPQWLGWEQHAALAEETLRLAQRNHAGQWLSLLAAPSIDPEKHLERVGQGAAAMIEDGVATLQSQGEPQPQM